MHWKFKETYTLDHRKQESASILHKYPDRVPIVVQKAPHSNLVDLDKHKFLVPYDVTVAQFMWILRQRLTMSPNKAIYLFINRTLPQSSALLGELYARYKDEDGFLYVMYSGENTFG
ncbi:Gamma-aminobutyric acid receptor-associated protein-like 2 [Halotydeus destructor]|nr:Gamma-aminobutyric acid receptor-associated protein-like 2 [Halotydeus destructor]